MKTIHLLYGPLLQDQSGLPEETVVTGAANAAELFEELRKRHGFRYGCGLFQVVINGQIQSLKSLIDDGDTVMFLPPIGGG